MLGDLWRPTYPLVWPTTFWSSADAPALARAPACMPWEPRGGASAPWSSLGAERNPRRRGCRPGRGGRDHDRRGCGIMDRRAALLAAAAYRAAGISEHARQIHGPTRPATPVFPDRRTGPPGWAASRVAAAEFRLARRSVRIRRLCAHAAHLSQTRVSASGCMAYSQRTNATWRYVNRLGQVSV